MKKCFKCGEVVEHIACIWCEYGLKEEDESLQQIEENRELAKKQLGESKEERELMFKNVKDYVQNIPKLAFEKTRQKEVVEERRKAIKCLKDIYKFSFPQIAKVLGYKDHTSCVHLYYKK